MNRQLHGHITQPDKLVSKQIISKNFNPIEPNPSFCSSKAAITQPVSVGAKSSTALLIFQGSASAMCEPVEGYNLHSINAQTPACLDLDGFISKIALGKDD